MQMGGAPLMTDSHTASFNPSSLRDRLAKFPAALHATATVASPADARWKPAPEHWSILEVCCHLLDEEGEDFRPRAESTLRDPTTDWPKLDLKDVAQRRRYIERDLGETLAKFAAARAANICWLDSLGAGAEWPRARAHPQFGPLSAGMLLAAWAAHDSLHLRQIAKRLHELAARDAGPYSVIYAGEW